MDNKNATVAFVAFEHPNNTPYENFESEVQKSVAFVALWHNSAIFQNATVAFVAFIPTCGKSVIF